MATLTTCLSLIQEAAAASARRALGMNKEKVTKDNIVYIEQRADIRVGSESANSMNGKSTRKGTYYKLQLMQVPGPEEPDYEAHRDESTCVIPMDDGPDGEAPPTRPASAALSESASALPGAIDSDGGSEGEEEDEDKEEDGAEDNDEEKGRWSDQT